MSLKTVIGLLLVLGAARSSSAQVSISNGNLNCGGLGIAQEVYAVNSNASRAATATIGITATDNKGHQTQSQRQVSIPAGGKTLLGCNKAEANPGFTEYSYVVRSSQPQNEQASFHISRTSLVSTPHQDCDGVSIAGSWQDTMLNGSPIVNASQHLTPIDILQENCNIHSGAFTPGNGDPWPKHKLTGFVNGSIQIVRESADHCGVTLSGVISLDGEELIWTVSTMQAGCGMEKGWHENRRFKRR